MIDSEYIKKELLKVGIQVNSVYDLVNTKELYPEAIPILVDLVQKEFFDERDKEGVIRALTVKEAKGFANKALLSEFKKMSKEKRSSYVGWAFGNALDILITNEDENEVLSIVQDKDNGTSRQMFVLALGKIKTEKTIDVLINLLDDEDVYSHAIEALGQLKAKKAREKLEPFLNHPKAFVRREAKKALKRIGND